jgi:hypothetical protein
VLDTLKGSYSIVTEALVVVLVSALGEPYASSCCGNGYSVLSRTDTHRLKACVRLMLSGPFVHLGFSASAGQNERFSRPPMKKMSSAVVGPGRCTARRCSSQAVLRVQRKLGVRLL